jgi:hypothetical protein
MTLKLVLLKSGETIISDVKEVQQEEKLYGYLFTNPQRVFYDSPVLVPEEQKESSVVNVSLTKWILLSKSNEIVVPFDWVVTIVDPIESLEKMYNPDGDVETTDENLTQEEGIDGSDN